MRLSHTDMSSSLLFLSIEIKIFSKESKAYVLMARLSRTKITRLIRGSSFEGGTSFTYLQFFIKNGEN